LVAAERWARAWGADFVNLGAAGHINAEAGFGPWPEALTLLERLRRAAEFRETSERLAAWNLSQRIPQPRQSLRIQPPEHRVRCKRSRRRCSLAARGRLDRVRT
ncbi:MAG TPA: alpha/beta hydrolase, partial [Hyphomicrobium sp.]|nr:alpha/beta hydrolase [Hyphomicrobium sp.]